MTDAATTATDERSIAQRMFGDLADDVLTLRGAGKLVARWKDGFRIGTDVVSAEELQERARKEREKAKASLKVLQQFNLCGCGRPSNHLGRCSARRGEKNALIDIKNVEKSAEPTSGHWQEVDVPVRRNKIDSAVQFAYGAKYGGRLMLQPGLVQELGWRKGQRLKLYAGTGSAAGKIRLVPNSDGRLVLSATTGVVCQVLIGRLPLLVDRPFALLAVEHQVDDGLVVSLPADALNSL